MNVMILSSKVRSNFSHTGFMYQFVCFSLAFIIGITGKITQALFSLGVSQIKSDRTKISQKFLMIIQTATATTTHKNTYTLSEIETEQNRRNRIQNQQLLSYTYRQDKGNKPRERKREMRLLLSNRITSNNSNIHREKINASGERERKRVVASGAVSQLSTSFPLLLPHHHISIVTLCHRHHRYRHYQHRRYRHYRYHLLRVSVVMAIAFIVVVVLEVEEYHHRLNDNNNNNVVVRKEQDKA